MRLTEGQFQTLTTKRVSMEKSPSRARSGALGRLPPPPGMAARGTAPKRAQNKTEAAYALHLEARRQAGDVLWFAFEAIKLRLADATFYTPDYLVMLADGTMEAHEVKGFWRDDARVKIKVAAGMFPFRFLAVQREGGTGWKVESFGPA